MPEMEDGPPTAAREHAPRCLEDEYFPFTQEDGPLCPPAPSLPPPMPSSQDVIDSQAMVRGHPVSALRECLAESAQLALRALERVLPCAKQLLGSWCVH